MIQRIHPESTASPRATADRSHQRSIHINKCVVIWDKPEIISPLTLTNPTGAKPLADGEIRPANINPKTNGYGEVGNLGLTEQEEIDLVNFMSTLTDGYSLPSK